MEPEKDFRVVHGRKPEDYDCFPRRIAQDEGLTPEALGLLCYLYSLPHNWEIWMSQVEKWSGWKRDKRQSVMRTCVDHGYLELVRGGEGKGSYYRMTEKLALHMLDAPDSDNRKIRSSPQSDNRKNRQPENPTVGKSGPIQIQHSDTDKTSITNQTGGVGDFFIPSDWGFLGDDVRFGDRARELLHIHGTHYEEMWAAAIGSQVNPAQLALAYTAAGPVRFAAAVAITEFKSRVPGRQLEFARSVLTNMPPAPTRPTGQKSPVPQHMKSMLSATGLVSETAKSLCISELGLRDDQFEPVAVDGHEEPYYRPSEEAADIILA